MYHKAPERQKTVVVAGGAGFIGVHLCEALLGAGHQVICVDNFQTSVPENVFPWRNHPRFRLIEQDICALEMSDEPVDEVYNLACPASPPLYQADPMHTMLTNVLGTRNLLMLALAHGARFVQASTSEIYGDPEQHPQAEDYAGHVNCTGPRACYDEGKRAAEAMIFDMLRSGRLDARVARIFNTYGPRMRPDDGRIVSNFIVQALNGEPITIYGSGRQTRSFCYVSDLVAGLMALMNVRPNPGAPVNLGNPGEFTVRQLAEMVRTRTGSQSPVIHAPLPADDPQKRRPDISRAREVLGWSPQVPLAQGLEPTIAWFSQEAGRKAPPAAAGQRYAGKAAAGAR